MSLFSKTQPRGRWHDRSEQEGHETMVNEQPGLAEAEASEATEHDQ